MNKKIKLSVGLIMLSVFTLFGFFVAATPASALTCNSFTLRGIVNDTGTPPAYVWFEYGTNYNTVANGGGTRTAERVFNYEGFNIPVEQYISGLSENTTYYYQLVIENGYGINEGGINNFRTPACQQNNPPTVSLSANPSTIQSGQSSTLSWNSQNATSCSSSWSGNNSTSGSQTVSPTGTTTYNITCTNSTGQSANASATVNVTQVQNPTVNLTANPSTIQSGQSSTLTWTSTNASSCIPSWRFWGSATSGSDIVSPTSTTTYSVSCSGINGGSAYATATVNVNQVQTCQDTSANNYGGTLPCTYNNQTCRDTSAINYGGPLPCRYQVQTCRDTSANNYGGALPCTYNVQTCRDTSANNYGGTLPCTYNAQICQDVNAINYRGTLPCRYNPVNYQPTVVLYADQASVPFNGSATVRWLTTNATSCFASGGSVGWAGSKSIGPGAFFTGSLTESKFYSITCNNNVGSATDSVTINVRGVVINNPRPPTSLVLISSSVDRNQPIVPTIDNTRPRPGDEINYTVNYQNIGTGAITGLTLRMNLPYEVDYMFSNPSNPTRSGNTLIFNLGTLKANGQGTVTVRVRVRENIPAGTNLNFPATLSYVDPSGQPQSVNANVSAQVWSDPIKENIVPVVVPLGANVFGAGFLPANLFGWLILLVLVLALALLAKYLFGSPFSKQTTTTSNQAGGAKKTTTTTLQ